MTGRNVVEHRFAQVALKLDGAEVAAMGSAAFGGPGEAYRYSLSRVWDPRGPRVLWVLLNPSVATQDRLDPTLTRCAGYSYRWGFGGFSVVNIFALRSTDPGRLKGAVDPVGPENDEFIRMAHLASNLTVVGWGTHGAYLGRGAAVADLLSRSGKPVSCLGVTKHGEPRHPLYLGSNLRPVPWGGSGVERRVESPKDLKGGLLGGKHKR